MTRHKWTHEQKITLCILSHFFRNSWDHYTEIFNTMYRTALRTRVLQIQLFEVNSNRRGENVLLDVNGKSLLSGTSLQVRLQKCKCIKIARECGIKLVERANESHNIADLIERCPSEMSEYVPESDSSISSGSPTRARKRRMAASKRTAIAISKASALKPSAEVVPSILFRVYDENSQGINSATYIRAGRPQEQHHKANAPADKDHGLLLEFCAHINGRRQPSPFISTSNSLVWILHKAFELRGAPYLAIIDGRAIGRHTRLYYAKVLLRLARSSSAYHVHSKTYRGAYEWLVWHQIPQQAIIGHVSLAAIRRLAEWNSCIDAMMAPLKSSGNTPKARLAFRSNILGARPGLTIGALLGLLLPQTRVNEPVVIDFITIITQNWSNCDKSIPIDMQCPSFWDDIISGLGQPYQVVHSGSDVQCIPRSPGITSEQDRSTVISHLDSVRTPIRSNQLPISQLPTPPLTHGLSQSGSGEDNYAIPIDNHDVDLDDWDSTTLASTSSFISASPSEIEADGAQFDDTKAGWLPLLPGIESYIDSSQSSAIALQHETTKMRKKTGTQGIGLVNRDNPTGRMKDVVKKEPGTGSWTLYKD